MNKKVRLSLLSTKNGKPRKAIVERKSQCQGCKCNLEKDTVVMEIPVKNGFTAYKRYCDYCFQQVLNNTKNDLEKVVKEFSNKSVQVEE